MASETSLLGAAGEHYVMCELLRRGYIAALAPQGVPNMDIVVTTAEGENLCAIQVKSRRDVGADGGWHMRPKHETLINDNIFYIFVDLGKTPEHAPKTYIIKSVDVAKALSKSHAAWLKNPGKGGRKRKDNPMRRLLPDYTKAFLPDHCPYPKGWLKPFKDAWHLIEAS